MDYETRLWEGIRLNCIMAESAAFAFRESFQNQRFITIRTHEGHGSSELTGIVTRIDPGHRRIQLSHNRGADWIPTDEIVDVLIGFDD